MASRGTAADDVEDADLPSSRRVAPAMSPMGACVEFVALDSAVGEEVVYVDAFDDAEGYEEEAVASPNRPRLCAAEVVVQGYVVRGFEAGYRRTDAGGVVNRQGEPPYHV